jgi:lactaldehyde reductase
MGFSNVGLGLVHAMAHPLGAFYHAAHVANAILLPHVMRFNAESTGAKFREIARAMGVDGIDAMTIEDARIEAIRAVAELASDLGAPGPSTRSARVRTTSPALAAAAMADVWPGGSPREATLDDVIALHTAAFQLTSRSQGRLVARSDRATRPDFSGG